MSTTLGYYLVNEHDQTRQKNEYFSFSKRLLWRPPFQSSFRGVSVCDECARCLLCRRSMGNLDVSGWNELRVSNRRARRTPQYVAKSVSKHRWKKSLLGHVQMLRRFVEKNNANNKKKKVMKMHWCLCPWVSLFCLCDALIAFFLLPLRYCFPSCRTPT